MLIQKGPGFWEQEEGTRFLVVDLDVISRRSLAALPEAFGRRVVGTAKSAMAVDTSSPFMLVAGTKRSTRR
jgi:hypothetical protein